MSKKSDRIVSAALGGGESVSRLKKAIKRVFKKSDDKIEMMLQQITSIQACKDAALTGDEDLRILAVCRLGEFGVDAFDSLDIALDDESPMIRTMAAGMLAYTKRNDAIPILKQHTVENNPTVKEMVDYSLEWLTKYGRDVPKGKAVPKSRENPSEIMLETDIVPLRTTDDVLIINDYTTSLETLEYGITIENEGKSPISDVIVKILAYPIESIQPIDSLSQSIDSIESGKSGSLIFGFRIVGECIEGEIITSVHLVDSKGEELSAKSGNVFVRSLFSQFTPLKINADEFVQIKSRMKQWNREHVILAKPKDLFESFLLLLEGKNFHLFQNEILERDGVFMGVVAGAAEGKFTQTRVAVSITVAGSAADKLSRLRIDVFAENPELIQTAASDLFETIQTDLGILDEN